MDVHTATFTGVGIFSEGRCYVLDICLVCVCFVSVLPVRTEWLVSYGVIKFFCEDGSVFGNGVYFAQLFIFLLRKLAC